MRRGPILVALVACAACHRSRPTAPGTTERAADRSAMVDQQLVARGIRDPHVLAAMRKVPRHAFVPPEMAAHAYDDNALEIGEDQTISEPYIVAFMTELLAVDERDKVLEIGTGSGYQAAVLAEIAGDVYTIEIVEPLAKRADETLHQLGYTRVHVRAGDGYRGWPEAAPFDAIIVTAAAPEIPKPLEEQLAIGGRLVIPLGGDEQELVLERRVSADKYERTSVLPVDFVPMTGEVLDQLEDAGAQ